MVGGLSARSWKHFYIILPYAVTGFFLTIILAKRLNILLLGDDIARSLGLNVEKNRLLFIALAALLAASAVSVAGLLGFVGLIVPHMTRFLIGSDYRFLLPACALTGSCLLMACDTVGKGGTGSCGIAGGHYHVRVRRTVFSLSVAIQL